MTVTKKILFKDVVPYDTPSSLDALNGPASGEIELPLAIYWGPRRRYALSDDRDLRSAYQALVRDGTTQAQEDMLNEVLLLRVWSALVLPERCRRIWEDRFPNLRA
jgi:hypothetical protein